MPEAQLRIGELARRSGVSPELLRAWERRYGLLEPVRTDGGYRLYSDEDEARVAAMRAHLAGGMSAAQAAHLARTGGVAGGADMDLAGELWAALDAFDDAGAQRAFDRLVAALSFETIARVAVLPYLQTTRGALARRRRVGGPGALRERRAPRATARARARMGPRARPSRAARVPVPESVTTSGW